MIPVCCNERFQAAYLPIASCVNSKRTKCDALGTLASKVEHPEKQQYKVWEDDYNAKDVFSSEFLEQKMSYIHSNPCQPHWKLSETPEEYLWSTARYSRQRSRASFRLMM